MKRITAHGFGFALAAIVVWALGAFGGIAVPAEVAVAFGTVAAGIVEFLGRQR